MWMSEQILYGLARLLVRTEVAHSAPMKAALKHIDDYDAYRGGQLTRILAAAQESDVDLRERVIVDFGCNDGAITPGR